MKVYAIRHTPTGLFMPVPTGKNGSGSSYWEPVDGHYSQINKTPVDGVIVYGTPLPRLFTYRRSASSALTQWLRGRHVPITSGCSPCVANGFTYDDELIRVDIVPVPERKADDMEIVAFELVEVGK
jgi:hypothetical protein